MCVLGRLKLSSKGANGKYFFAISYSLIPNMLNKIFEIESLKFSLKDRG